MSSLSSSESKISLSPPIERIEVLSSPVSKRPRSLYSQISTNKNAALKCQFCLECFDLYDIFDHKDGLSSYLTVSVSNDSGNNHGNHGSLGKSPGKKWAVIGRTYIVENDCNPQFHDKEFDINDVVVDAGLVLIQTYALHPANSMPVCIGTCQIAIKEMLHSDTVVKRLRVGDWEKGTVVIFMRAKKESKYPFVADIAEYCSIADICSDELAQMSYNEDDYKNTHFKDVLGNINRQRYHFNLRQQLSRSLRVSEEMFELATSFNIPALYIRLLCEREHKNMIILQSMVQGFSEEVSSIAAVSRATKISQYRDELAQLGHCSKHSFKRSECKAQSEYKWAPVNLHAQVLEVSTVDQKTNISCSRDHYCLLTVGAWCGHWDKFKNGGLLSLLDGDKFSERREKYRVLKKVEALMNSHTLSDDAIEASVDSDKLLVKDIVSDLILLSKEKVTRTALEGLQRTLDSDKQLEIMTLSADLEKIVANIKVTSKETLSEVCRSYCVHVQRALVWSITQVELDNREHFLNLLNRFEACFSQLLSAVVSGFIVSLCFRTRNLIFQLQLSDLVIPVMFESLLSTHGDESGMLEDMQFVIKHISDITVQLERSTDSDQVSVSSITGTQFAVVVTISVPSAVLEQLPASVQQGGSITFFPLFFNHGINEQQTIAYKINETGQQDKICEQFLEDLQFYIDKHITPNICVFDFKVENGLTSNVEKLKYLFKATKRGKCSDFIVLAEQIGRDIGCVRFTSCKSAKDRTSMSITYEYCNILCQQHDFHKEDIPPVLEQFRRDGTRYHNTFKNIGSYKYCFNKLQCKMLPPIYKPPPGTFGDGAQQT
ncbi:uncharacterized protein LOC134821302 isoform X2 [Bolinopsis microptera]|uniref:uncharacterized protein LOC134821302 isoform X2 n=1 Tax=Bolinopsis microptera TaxID=2820187 RepID=UPI003079970B